MEKFNSADGPKEYGGMAEKQEMFVSHFY